MQTAELSQGTALAVSAGQIWRGAYGRLTVGLLLLAKLTRSVIVTTVAYEALAVATMLPNTTAELGGLALYGWVFAAFMLANLFGVVVAGWAIDRAGAAPPFLIGIALFVVGLLSAGLAPFMLALIGARTLQGFGAGFNSSVAYAVGTARTREPSEGHTITMRLAGAAPRDP